MPCRPDQGLGARGWGLLRGCSYPFLIRPMPQPHSPDLRHHRCTRTWPSESGTTCVASIRQTRSPLTRPDLLLRPLPSLVSTRTQDRVIAIDLEWRPEYVAGRSSPVALMQLASATTCVLLRISSLGYRWAVVVLQADTSTVVDCHIWD